MRLAPSSVRLGTGSSYTQDGADSIVGARIVLSNSIVPGNYQNDRNSSSSSPTSCAVRPTGDSRSRRLRVEGEEGLNDTCAVWLSRFDRPATSTTPGHPGFFTTPATQPPDRHRRRMPGRDGARCRVIEVVGMPGPGAGYHGIMGAGPVVGVSRRLMAWSRVFRWRIAP